MKNKYNNEDYSDNGRREQALYYGNRLLRNRKKRDKGATQVDYILAAGIFILFFALVVQFITDYFSGVKDTTDTMSLRSQALGILTAADRGFDPAAWPQLTNNSNDLVMLLHFNNDTLDYSGKGNNGTATAGANCSAAVTGKFFGGCSFDGVDDYVDAGTGESVHFSSGEITVEAWIKITAYKAEASIYPGIVSNYGSTATTGGYLLSLSGTNQDNKTFFFLRQNSTIFESVFTNEALSTGVWHHIVGLRDASNVMKIYVNGVQQTYTTIYTGTFPSTTNLYFGKYSSNYFNGTIDEVAIYNRSLAASEILSHYQQGLNRLGFRTDAYRFTVIVNNTKPYLANTSENATAQELDGELVKINMSAFGFANIDYNSIRIYDTNNTPRPYQLDGSNVTFNASVAANESVMFAVYFDDDSVFPPANSAIAGANNLTEIIHPVEKIPVLQYFKLRHLNETNYTSIKNTAGIESSFSIKVYDIDDNTTFMSFGGSVPRSGDVVALQRYVLFQNSTAGIRNGRLTVQTW